IDDILRVDGNVFTTRAAGAAKLVTRSLSVKPNEVLVGKPVRDYLLHLIKMGTYAVTEVHSGGSPLAWAFMDDAQANLDIFWSCFHSLYVSQLYATAGHGRIVVPVISNAPFTVDGVDSDTGIKLFSRAYDGIPAGEPGIATGVPALQQNAAGPIPVSGTPFSIDLVKVVAGLDTIKAVPGVTIDTTFAINNPQGSATGAPFGQTRVATFTTDPPAPDNTHIDASLIHITIPVNGVSVVSGTAGALPVHDIALAVRRGKFFVRTYSVEVTAADGSFTLPIGNSIGDDVVTMADVIDLQVLDKDSRSPIAIIPLTPFASPDGLGFVAPVGLAVTFRSSMGVTVKVPAGAFDVPTLIRIAPAAASAFAQVPSVSEELNLVTSITLTFEGTANKPLDVDIPVPPNTPTSGHDFYLGRLGESVQGPRVE
ncbi:MAG TPA: hypothetical protein VKJ07_14500, partial [Mycobacteriales bacterium]|nr:hypothetical protein [Mycobacteriales bacterium]